MGPQMHAFRSHPKLSTTLLEPVYRGQRRAQGHAALVLLLPYARDKLGVAKGSFMARIGAVNVRNIALFSRLGSKVVRTISVVGEVEMRVVDANAARSWPGAGQVREYSLASR